MKKVYDFLLFSNLYVALPVSALAWATCILFYTEVDYRVITFIYLSTFTIYNLHRVVGLMQIKSGDLAPRHQWARDHLWVHYGGLVLGSLGIIYHLIQLEADFLYALLPSAAIAMGYSAPIIKRNGKFWRLRDLPFAKVFLISITVSYVTTYLPMYNFIVTDPWNLTLLGFFCARFFFILAITIPFDIRDVDFDAPSSLNTLPLLFGIDKAKTISLYSLAFFAGLSFMLFRDSVWASIALMVSAGIAAWVVSYARKDSSEYYFSFFVEGTMLVQFLLVWALVI